MQGRKTEENATIAETADISRGSALNPTRANTMDAIEIVTIVEKLDIQPETAPRAKEMEKAPGPREDTKEPGPKEDPKGKANASGTLMETKPKETST